MKNMTIKKSILIFLVLYACLTSKFVKAQADATEQTEEEVQA